MLILEEQNAIVIRSHSEGRLAVRIDSNGMVVVNNPQKILFSGNIQGIAVTTLIGRTLPPTYVELTVNDCRDLLELFSRKRRQHIVAHDFDSGL